MGCVELTWAKSGIDRSEKKSRKINQYRTRLDKARTVSDDTAILVEYDIGNPIGDRDIVLKVDAVSTTAR